MSATPVHCPLHLLVVVAQPANAPRLNADAELDRLRQGLDRLERLGVWQVEVLRGPDTLHQLYDHRRRDAFHALHYIGHGLVEAQHGFSGLVLEDATGQAQLADADALNSALAGFRRPASGGPQCLPGWASARRLPFRQRRSSTAAAGHRRRRRHAAANRRPISDPVLRLAVSSAGRLPSHRRGG